MSNHKPWKVHKTGHVILPDGNTIAIPCIDGEDNRAALSIMIAAAPETAAERDRLKALNVELLETVEELLKEAPRGTTYLKARSLLAKAEDA